jgi:CRP-like cAMP-binding protein
MNKSESNAMMRILNKHSLFKGVKDEYKYRLIKRMRMYSLDARETVVEQGAPAVNFYMLTEGSVEVLVDGEPLNTLKAGDTFGDIALLQETTRSATVKTLTPCKLWVVSKSSFESMLDEVTERNYDAIKTFIKTVPLFNKLDVVVSDSLIRSLRLLTYRKDEVVFREKERGHLMYIVMSGSVTATKGREELKKFTQAEFFGEQALLYDSLRSATLTCNENCKLLALSKMHLEALLGKMTTSILYKNVIFISISKSASLKRLRQDKRENLASFIMIKSYRKGDVVIPERSKVGAVLAFILKGSVLCEGRLYTVYDCIGDADLLRKPNSSYTCPVTAEEEAIVGLVTRDRFEQSIGGSLASQENNLLEMLNSIPVFSNLSDERMTQMIKVRTRQGVVPYEYSIGEHIYLKGEAAEDIYVIQSGEVSISDGLLFKGTIGMKEYFGEYSVLHNCPREASATAVKTTVVWALSRYLLKCVLDKARINLMKGRISFQELRRVKMSELVPIELVVTNDLWSSYVVKIDDTDHMVFLKSWNKQLLESSHQDLFERVKTTCKLGATIDYPMIAKHIKAFKNEYRVFFMKQYLSGVNLQTRLKEVRRFPEETIKEYITQIMLMIEYLHAHSIVHRDITPKAFRILDNGRLYMEDYSIAESINGRTFTFLTDPYYASPEIFSRDGYGLEADMWSLGILAYTLAYGHPPFGTSKASPDAIHESIMNAEVTFPSKSKFKTSPEFRNFIQALLNPNRAPSQTSTPAQMTLTPHLPLENSRRNLESPSIGSRLMSIKEAKTHPWVSRTDWVRSTQSTILSQGGTDNDTPIPLINDSVTQQLSAVLAEESYGHDVMDWEEGTPI